MHTVKTTATKMIDVHFPPGSTRRSPIKIYFLCAESKAAASLLSSLVLLLCHKPQLAAATLSDHWEECREKEHRG